MVLCEPGWALGSRHRVHIRVQRAVALAPGLRYRSCPGSGVRRLRRSFKYAMADSCRRKGPNSIARYILAILPVVSLHVLSLACLGFRTRFAVASLGEGDAYHLSSRLANELCG